MVPPPLGDRIKVNGAYRHPALDARGVVCIAEAARIARDRPARPFNAPSLLLFREWRSEFGVPHYDGARKPLVHLTLLYPDPFLRSRPACARTARSARPYPRVTQFGLQVSPIFLLFCAPLFVRRSLQCDSFSRGAGALHAKDHERPLGDLAFPWRARERPASRCRVLVDPKTIHQEYHDDPPFCLRHLHQTTSFLRDCRHRFYFSFSLLFCQTQNH